VVLKMGGFGGVAEPYVVTCKRHVSVASDYIRPRLSLVSHFSP
jgi:hypothetical protein